MNLLNFGREQLQKGMLNSMLEQVGIDDVGSFVKEFRNEANHEAAIATQEHQNEDENEDEDEDTTVRHASNQQANLFSKGSSLLNQFAGNRGSDSGGGNSMDMIQGAMKAYKMFSGSDDASSSGEGGGGGFQDNISSTYQNAQKMYAMYKQFDKNGDGKITTEDIEIFLQELGLGFVSPYLAKALFQAVDQNHNGTLDFTDLMALVTILNKLSGQFGGTPQ